MTSSFKKFDIYQWLPLNFERCNYTGYDDETIQQMKNLIHDSLAK